MRKTICWLPCLLMLCCFVSVSARGQGKNPGIKNDNNRAGKFLGLFQVVSFPNDACTGNGKNGTCYTESECSTRGGSPSGDCANGYGVCCVFMGKCGQTLSENCTYFESSSQAAGGCSLKICPCSSNICQLRLDFNMFVITGPSTLSTSVGKALNGQTLPTLANGVEVASASQCLTDKFSVSNPGGQTPPIICGSNTGEHMYVDASDFCNDLSFQLGGAAVGTALATRTWSIKATQYSCDYNNLAPTGCTQYFFNVGGTGTVQTFNFAGGQHLADQNQNICVRREAGNCRICWAATAAIDFAVSGDTNAVQKLFNPSQCCGYGAAGDDQNGFDCLNIPGALNPAKLSKFGNSRVCGRKSGLVAKTTAAVLGQQSICSDSVPFNIRFLSDSFENTGAMKEAAKLDVGFKLAYKQNSDGCN